MRILEQTIHNAHYNRDFGRVEARVSMVVKGRPGTAIHSQSVLVSVPARASESDKSLRERLLIEAEQTLEMLAPPQELYAHMPMAA
ncbi:hypothetical protein IV417_11365 [Alphaproteobacteria bacterium KMM 3653]|uniref:Uncharacterized protein n=1 Tax=Harenicola maris TaxID=2841044 RepID=A0AAP2CR42_9RHOB|nr:hypothetical protein [Harenicola maris]